MLLLTPEAAMTTSTATVPVTVTPEAAARIAELGFQTQIEQMIEYARGHLPDVVRIEVVLNERYDMGGEPGVTVEAYGTRPFVPGETISWDLIGWAVDTFPSEILEHLHVSYLRGGAHAG
jgi:hypothetical protein